MGNFIDLTGQMFGDWYVIERAFNRNNKPAYLCLCKCGRKKEIHGASLRTGASRSCKSCGKTRYESSSPLRAARLRLKMTQSEFSLHTGLDKKTISNAERENRFLSGHSRGVQAQRKFNKACPEMREPMKLYKPSAVGGKNNAIVVKNCSYCGGIVHQIERDAKRLNPNNPESSRAFCNKRHWALFQHHGALKRDAQAGISPGVVAQHEHAPRVRQKRDLWVGTMPLLKKQKQAK